MNLIPVCLIAGCGGANVEVIADLPPTDLLPFQGIWKFDEARLFKDRRASAKSDEEFAQFRKLYDEAKARGAGTAPRLVVSGTTLVEEGATLEGGYDILDYKTEGKQAVCKAIYHEDRHDTGDANVIGLVLEISPSPSGDTLILRKAQGAQPTFYRRNLSWRGVL